MNPRPLSGSLYVLIGLAEEIVRKPAHLLPTVIKPEFYELAAQIYQADASPAADGTRCTFAGVIMCKAIEALFSDLKGDDHYLSTVGHTLPRLRFEAWTAMNQEKAAREGETRR